MQEHHLSIGNAILKYFFLFLFFLLFKGYTSAQQDTISGTITNSKTGEPIPYVNISIKNSTIVRMADSLGNFMLIIPAKFQVIVFSVIGFNPLEKNIREIGNKSLMIELTPKQTNLSEVSVNYNEDPVKKLLEEITSRKSLNNPDQYSRFSYQKYTKWEYQINNVPEKIINSQLFRNYKSVFKTDIDNSKYLPLYFSEQLVNNEVQKDPSLQKSTVISDKTTAVGILKDLEISGYTSALDMEVNFYNNFINLFTQNFVSPIANNGWFFYKYYLVDSAAVNGHLQYRVNFHPRRAGENTFKGYFIVENQHYSLIEIDGDLSSTSSLNFLKSMHLKSNYAFVNDSTPFYKRNQINAVFDYVPFKNQTKHVDHLSLFYNQTALIDQVKINPGTEIKLSTAKAKYETVKLPNSNTNDSIFWKQNRMETLTKSELEAGSVIDSISRIGFIRYSNDLAKMALTSYYDIGKIELGPYTSVMNTNEIEGLHLFMGARTSDEISKNFNIWGGVGYGFLNKKINSMFGVGYKFPTQTRQILKASYDDKMIRFGENEKILYLYENAFSATENNLVSQFLKYRVLDEMFREQKISVSYERDWYPGLLNKLSASFTTHYSPQYYPFLRNGLPLNSVSNVEILLDTRFSKEEKVIDKGFLRIYVGTEYPIVHFVVGGGKTFYNGQSNFYGRVMAIAYQQLNFGQTNLNYALEAGAYLGKLPYTMLDIPRGNETLGYYTYDFNLLNYLEYVHDRYLHCYLEYHLNGFFFRRVPLLKRAHLREVCSARLMVGSLSDKHQQIIDYPTVVTKMKNPYLEVGTGIENIFRIIRVEAYWRITPQSVIGAPSFGLKAQLKLKL